MVEFKQFYTSETISDLLVSLLSHTDVASCLELSAGEGALLDAILKRFSGIKITAIDIDNKNFHKLLEKYPEHRIFCCDSTHEELLDTLDGQLFDVAVCNPPFLSVSSNDYLRSIISRVFNYNVKTKKIRAEIIFLCINLLHLVPNGQLAIILPELFFSSDQYLWLRKALTEKYVINQIVECEHNSFVNTEAKTHIYHLVNRIPKKQHEFKITIKPNAFQGTKIIRLQDFVSKRHVETSTSFDDYFIIFRGKLSGKECKESSYPYFHTTSFNARFESFENSIEYSARKAQKNDILIARVGTRILGKTEVFLGNSAIVSDCIFCIRIFDASIREYFLNFWLQNRSDWLKNNAKGTCAKHISLYSVKELIESVICEYLSSEKSNKIFEIEKMLL
ncbi:N-6 DNA methylase [Sodalis sp. RH14]|uniref:N-6 DNA methylase n=1 Tax=Sodalis sp. RH14 TaxID=3394329 RepID=UPI0039B40BB3